MSVELGWFTNAIAQAPQVQQVRSHETDIELLTWGERGRPGLLLVHGAGGHAHWWAWTAPFLADQYRVAAMSLPGCGGSEWRARYSSSDLNDDALACAQAAGLWDTGPPVYVGHSIGGAQLFHGAVHSPERLRALLLVDSSFRRMGGRDAPSHPPRIYASESLALSRFRLMPPQEASAPPALLDYIARKGLRQIDQPDGQSGWAWRQDPDLWRKFEGGLEQGPFPDGPIAVRVPMAHILGDRSHVMLHPGDSPLAPEVPRIVIPDCGHHVMIDQPMALVALVRGLLAVWP
jgi:pimeloyl-ACP methyl ester carboxylesterase